MTDGRCAVIELRERTKRRGQSFPRRWRPGAFHHLDRLKIEALGELQIQNLHKCILRRGGRECP